MNDAARRSHEGTEIETTIVTGDGIGTGEGTGTTKTVANGIGIAGGTEIEIETANTGDVTETSTTSHDTDGIGMRTIRTGNREDGVEVGRHDGAMISASVWSALI